MKINIQSTDKSLTSQAGVALLHKLYDLLEMKKLDLHHPKMKNLIFSIFAGATCLDDLNVFRKDPAFYKSLRAYAPQTMHSYLDKFSERDLELLEDAYINLSFKLKKIFFPKDKEFILDMDGTDHEQRGMKMEGVTWNYKNKWCLSSQNVYDQHGISFAMRLRSGSTHSSVGSTELIQKIFKNAPANQKRFFRADSAYASKANYNALLLKNVSFTIPIRSDITQGLLGINKSIQWVKNPKVKFYQSDECELAEGFYPMGDLAFDLPGLRVVFLRAPIKNKLEQTELFCDEEYRYYSIVTNIHPDDFDASTIYEFYSKRANAENYIREQKYGFDFLHFPSKKLNKNRAYAIIGSIAYNFSRVLSSLDEKNNYFSKQLRLKLYNLPCLVIKHARSLTFKMNKMQKEVITETMANIQKMFSRFYELQVASG